LGSLRVGSKQLIKDLNRSLVIERIRNYGPLSRTDISKDLNLGLSTITNIVEELKNDNLVFETGEADSTGGRRPILLEFNYEFGYTIGIKIEENHVILALTNLRADVLDKVNLYFEKGEEARRVIEIIIEGIKTLVDNKGILESQLMGIGIAISGLVNGQKGTLIRSSLLGWTQVNIKEAIGRVIDVPIFIDNNVNAYAMAELQLGYGKTYDNFICVSVGAGVGAGIVIDKDIYYGQFGGAGEIGHSIIEVNGFSCHCGQRGCLEMYASDKFFVNRGPNLLKDRFSESFLKNSSFSSEEVYKAATDGDELARELLRESGEYLGIGLVNIINTMNPAIIILVGERMAVKDLFLPYTIKVAEQNFFSPGRIDTGVYTSELGNDAWVRGASLLAIKHLFQMPIYKNSGQKAL
jgi:N-acetylglucosamine repressor